MAYDFGAYLSHGRSACNQIALAIKRLRCSTPSSSTGSSLFAPSSGGGGWSTTRRTCERRREKNGERSAEALAPHHTRAVGTRKATHHGYDRKAKALAVSAHPGRAPQQKTDGPQWLGILLALAPAATAMWESSCVSRNVTFPCELSMAAACAAHTDSLGS
jgi:hypothetical protein